MISEEEKAYRKKMANDLFRAAYVLRLYHQPGLATHPDDSVTVHLSRDEAEQLCTQLKPLYVEGAYWVKPGTAEIEVVRTIS
jgi:hypothetical protein